MKADALIKVLEQYVGDAKVIAAHPTRLLHFLGLGTQSIFGRGTSFAVLSAGSVFFLLIPTLWLHGRIIKPESEELLNIFSVVVIGILFHISFKLFGGSATITETIGVYGFVL